MADCPVCGASSSLVLHQVGEYAVLECPACELRFSDPMRHPGPCWYTRSPLYVERRERKVKVPMFVTRRDWRYRTFFSLHMNPSGRLLEIGCGSGAFLSLAEQRGYRVTGIDADTSAIKTARQAYRLKNVRAVSIEELLNDSVERLFDVICLFDVLEHLQDPLATMQGLAAMLSDSGKIVCSVPSHQRWPHWFAGDVDLPPHHLTLWSRPSLAKCFEKAGLRAAMAIRSPLLGENLLNQANWRCSMLRRPDAVGMALRAGGQFVVMPVLARMLRLLVPEAGGFTLLGVGTKP